MIKATLIKAACDKAESFLLEHCLQNGWSDFITPIGESNEWVSAYVAMALGRDNSVFIKNKEIVARLCKKQRHNGGWAYNSRAPADTDSTSITLALLAGYNDLPNKNCKRAKNFILKHQQSNGGIATFRSTYQLRLLMRAFNVSFKGWLQSHECVTATALDALIRAGIKNDDPVILSGVEYLCNSVDSKTGLWRSYWWQGPYYSSSAAIRLFRSLKQAPPQHNQRMLSLISMQLENGSWGLSPGCVGSAFSSALAIDMLKEASNENEISCRKRGLNWLLEIQEDNGSWQAKPVLRIPHPNDTHPTDTVMWRVNGLGTGVLIQDQNRLFTTATILKVLKDMN